MDIATLFGLIVGLAMVFGAIMGGGSIWLFVDLHAFMIVVGGSLAAICINFPLNQVLQAFRAASKTLMMREFSDADVVNTMVRIAELSRREGIVALEHVHTNDAVLKKACMLIADNAGPELIKDSLLIEISSLCKRHSVAQNVFKRLGLLAPSLGLTGTLIGLVQMFANLDNPKSIGPAMSVAMICTFYGAMLSNLILTPIAGKLAARTQLEVHRLEIIFEGAKCILENNNPRLVYEKLSSFLSPKERRYAR